MRYRRAFIPGGSLFFTAVTEQRRPLFASAYAVGVLRTALRAVRSNRPFDVDAIVVLTDHLHGIWTLPPGDADFATRWQLIKTWFTKPCDPGITRRAASRTESQTGTGVMAAPLLGARAPGRSRCHPTRRVCAFQPGQTRACIIGDGVAVVTAQVDRLKTEGC